MPTSMRRIRMRAPMRVSTGVVDLGAERMNGLEKS
jgi:hypothetical protein